MERAFCTLGVGLALAASLASCSASTLEHKRGPEIVLHSDGGLTLDREKVAHAPAATSSEDSAVGAARASLTRALSGTVHEIDRIERARDEEEAERLRKLVKELGSGGPESENEETMRVQAERLRKLDTISKREQARQARDRDRALAARRAAWDQSVLESGAAMARVRFEDGAAGLYPGGQRGGVLLALAADPAAQLPGEDAWRVEAVDALLSGGAAVARRIRPGDAFEVPLGDGGKTLVILALLSKDELEALEPRASGCLDPLSTFSGSYVVVSSTFLPAAVASSPVLDPVRATSVSPSARHAISRRERREIGEEPYVMPFTSLDSDARPYLATNTTPPEALSVADVIPLVAASLGRFSSSALIGGSTRQTLSQLGIPATSPAGDGCDELLEGIRGAVRANRKAVFLTASAPATGAVTRLTLCDAEGCPQGKSEAIARATLASQRALVRPAFAVAIGAADYRQGSPLASSGYAWARAESAGGPDDLYVLASTEQPLAAMQTALSIGLNVDFGSAEDRELFPGIHLGLVPLSLAGLNLRPTPQLGALASLRVYGSLGVGVMAFARQIDALASGEAGVGDVRVVGAGSEPAAPRTVKAWESFFAAGVTVDLEGTGKATRDAITKRFGGQK